MRARYYYQTMLTLNRIKPGSFYTMYTRHHFCYPICQVTLSVHIFVRPNMNLPETQPAVRRGHLVRRQRHIPIGYRYSGRSQTPILRSHERSRSIIVCLY